MRSIVRNVQQSDSREAKMIFGRHSVLKRGCSTWDPTQVPQAEFQARLDARAAMKWRGKDLDALVIYGDNYSFADLCYLTNYFPKVRGGIAVVPREGAISLAAQYRQPRCAFRQDVDLGRRRARVKPGRRRRRETAQRKGFRESKSRSDGFRQRVSLASVGGNEGARCQA